MENNITFNRGGNLDNALKVSKLDIDLDEIGGLNKILFFESLFFGVKSLVYALPVSFGIICLIHLSLANMLDISHLLIPWNSIILSIVMVFVIVLLTMLYSTNKIKKQNIIEQIREENI